jgi:large subunit ribosomal protein L1
MTKNLKKAYEKVDSNKFYELNDAIKLVKEVSYEKFDPTIDLAFKLNLDVRQADQQLRGSIPLKYGTGKIVKILAATDDIEQQKKAKELGAEIVVGLGELDEILTSNKFNFDIIVAEPKMMSTLGKYGQILGPKGLMPNLKTGTITTEIGKAINEIKKGKANYRTDKNGVVHTIIGKKSIDTKKLVENAQLVIDSITKLKPQSVKGIYIQNICVSSTMGPSIKIKII